MIPRPSTRNPRGDRRVRRRWVHLLLGGALLMPYFLLVSALLPLVWPGADPLRSLGVQLLAYGISLPLAAATGWLFPVVRTLERAAAQALLGLTTELDGTATSRSARLRTASWFTMHVGVGAPVSGASLAVPPFAVTLLLVPFVPELRDQRWSGTAGWLPDRLVWCAPLLGFALLIALGLLVLAVGAVCARCAPALLGPTPADRLAAAERRAATLAARNRLARELHDSVGHALSAVTLQAGAARRVLDSDPEFVHEALTAIEGTVREAVTELDSVLGLLRTADSTETDGAAGGTRLGGSPVGPSTLARDLDGLVARTRAAGVPVETHLPSRTTLEALPTGVAQEGYRITREAVSNALRHAVGAPVWLRVALTEKELRITVDNTRTRPAATGHDTADGPSLVESAVTATGGRGLPGVAERALLLGGSAHAGPYGDLWRLDARLPLPSGNHRTGGCRETGGGGDAAGVGDNDSDTMGASR
ncbi:sensor histidine kinase [Streptomyces oceani]|uniref:sensor histidine kinase n=1 Tax=Streptomyces oceani TaxID=1075402 RepID=UPI000872DB18|nr:histidine kinase [Streptomyces oceani]